MPSVASACPLAAREGAPVSFSGREALVVFGDPSGLLAALERLTKQISA